MDYEMKRSAKWIAAGLGLGNLVMFLLFLLDSLYLVGILSQRLIGLSGDQWGAVGFLFLLLTLVGWLVTDYYTYEDGSTVFPDQARWRRRTLIGGWGGVLTYTVLQVLLIWAKPEAFFTLQLEVIPLVCSGSFLVSLFRSFLHIRKIHQGIFDTDGSG